MLDQIWPWLTIFTMGKDVNHLWICFDQFDHDDLGLPYTSMFIMASLILYGWLWLTKYHYVWLCFTMVNQGIVMVDIVKHHWPWLTMVFFVALWHYFFNNCKDVWCLSHCNVISCLTHYNEVYCLLLCGVICEMSHLWQRLLFFYIGSHFLFVMLQHHLFLLCNFVCHIIMCFFVYSIMTLFVICHTMMLLLVCHIAMLFLAYLIAMSLFF